MKNLDLPTQKIGVETLVQNYPYIKKAKDLNGIKPFILIGQKILTKVIQHNPVLSKTELGWVG
jgi:hypothetical protein